MEAEVGVGAWEGVVFVLEGAGESYVVYTYTHTWLAQGIW